MTKRGKPREITNKEELDRHLEESRRAVETALPDRERRERAASDALNAAAASSISASASHVEMETFQNTLQTDVLDDIFSHRVAQEFQRTEGQDDAVSNEIKRDHDAQDEINNKHHGAGSSKEARNLYAQYLIAMAGIAGSLTGVAGFIYVALKDSADNRPPRFSDPEIERLARAWKDRPDSLFWPEFSNYFQKNPEIAISDEGNTLKVVETMCDDTGWIWADDTGRDYNNAISDFARDIAVREGDTSTAYTNILTRTYLKAGAQTPTLLPRKVACNVLHMAIARYSRVPRT